MLRHRWFWLINLVLLLLFLWTMSEETTVHVQVNSGICTAVFPEGGTITRSSSIPCPGLSGGFVGLFFSNAGESGWIDKAPLDLFFPRSGWRAVTFSELNENGRRLLVEVADEVPGWRHRWGEWQPLAPAAAMQWQTPLHANYQVAARLRRPAEAAGLLFLQPDAENGWAFITNPSERRGVWWTWRDGQPGEPIVGIPYQKSFLAQAQSLLRRVLRAHQGALLLLLAAWLLIALGRGFGRFKPARCLRIPIRLSWPLSPWLEKSLLLILALLTFGISLIIAADVLEHMPHVQDSITYLFQAQLLAQGKLWAEAPQMPEFFEQEFLTVYDGRWFGQYPPGFPAVLAPGIWLGQPWLVNPILAMLSVILLYLLGKALYGRPTGLIAAILASTSPFLLFMSGSFMAHPAELFWMTLFMLAWTYALQRSARRWPLVAGLVLGMLFLTRQATAAAAALPFFAVLTLGIRKKQGWRSVTQKIGWLLLTALPFLAMLLLYQGALTGDPFRDPRTIARPFDRVGFGLAAGETPNAFKLHQADEHLVVDWYLDDQQPPRGHTPARGLYNMEKNWKSLELQLFGWLPILTLAFVWLAFLLQRPAAVDFALLAVFAGTVLVYVFYWSDGIMYGPRYYYAALPALFLLTARGIQAAGRRLGRAGRAALAIILAVLILSNMVLFVPALAATYENYNFVGRQERTGVEQAATIPALVFVENNPLNWWEYGRFFSANTPALDGPIIYARDLGADQNLKLRALYPDRNAYLWQFDQQQLLPFP